jgi:hypothetical protein
MLVARALPASQITPGKIGINFCTNPKIAPFTLGILILACYIMAPALMAQEVPTSDPKIIPSDHSPSSTVFKTQVVPTEAYRVNERFAGRWDLTVKDSDGREMPSWLEIILNQGACEANFVGRWGNSRPLPKIEINSDRVVFVSPKGEEGSENDLVFQGKLTENTLVGTALGPNRAQWSWTGRRAPALPRPAAVKWGEPQPLFNGLDLTGWTFDDPKGSRSWKVEDGCLVNHSAGANLITTGSFGDFKLHVELNCPSNANSGIYLRGRYEVQVEDDSLAEPANHHMGAIYGFLAPNPEQPRRPGQWQAFDIVLLGRFVTVTQNGRRIIEDREIPGITGGALNSNEELPGPIYLQGDHGGIAYRNLILTPRLP